MRFVFYRNASINLQKDALHLIYFSITEGSIKLKVDLNLTADSPFLLRDAIVQTLENLKEDAKRGELDLKLGRRHLTYSGFRSLIHLPEFVCDDGSILLDDLCGKKISKLFGRRV